MDFLSFCKENSVLKTVAAAKETVWVNPAFAPYVEEEKSLTISDAQIADAAARLERFAPFIAKAFPETAPQGGLIESPLTEISAMQRALAARDGAPTDGRLFLKQDSHLAIAGSVKARGGIYEVLVHTEELAFAAGLLCESDDYTKLSSEECRAFFCTKTIQVGSTGNLGLSIGIMSAAIGYHVVVHMSADAKQWKKDLLRSKGVTVIEYAADYCEAVRQGRALSDMDPDSYFVDDENSLNLFLGYAVAAERLAAQLKAHSITVDALHPLFVYIPCGVGGAPGGVCYGLKRIFKDNVHVFFTEPTEAPCMLLGMATGLHDAICVQDAGLSGITHADGLAVGRPSRFVGRTVEPLLSGIFTVRDARLYDDLRLLHTTENISVEPSACAGFSGFSHLLQYADTQASLKEQQLDALLPNATHIVWATGGRLVPPDAMQAYRDTYL